MPVTGISASERISISASATINNDSAAKTIVSVLHPSQPGFVLKWMLNRQHKQVIIGFFFTFVVIFYTRLFLYCRTGIYFTAGGDT